jgi:hypothetical protein
MYEGLPRLEPGLVPDLRDHTTLFGSPLPLDLTVTSGK